MFRRDQKNEDSFQRQISALRQQLGASAEDPGEDEITIGGEPTPIWNAPSSPDNRNSRSYGMSDSSAYGYPPEQNSAIFGLAVAEPMMPAVPSPDLHATVVAPTAKWKGELSTADPIHVHGQFHGTINSGSEVFIGQEAVVEATVIATSIVVAGSINGKLIASGRLEVLPTGRVTGDVQSPSLVIHQGALLTGSVRMSSESPKETNPVGNQKTAKSSV